MSQRCDRSICSPEPEIITPDAEGRGRERLYRYDTWIGQQPYGNSGDTIPLLLLDGTAVAFAQSSPNINIIYRDRNY